MKHIPENEKAVPPCLAGGLLFSILLGLWITSAAWFFSISGVAL